MIFNVSDTHHSPAIDEGSAEQNIQETTMERKKKINLRRELVDEMVTTEHEYIHDLEALIQVVKCCRNMKEAAAVDLPTVMGNINEVRFN